MKLFSIFILLIYWSIIIFAPVISNENINLEHSNSKVSILINK